MTSYNLLQGIRAKLVAQLPFSFRDVDKLLFLIYACQKNPSHGPDFMLCLFCLPSYDLFLSVQLRFTAVCLTATIIKSTCYMSFAH